MAIKSRIITSIGILVLLVVVFYLVTSAITKFTGYSIFETFKERDFKECLKENNIILYINSRDTLATLDELKTSDYLRSVEVYNCFLDKSYCDNEGVDFYPTWDKDGKKIEGDINVNSLSEFSGCSL